MTEPDSHEGVEIRRRKKLVKWMLWMVSALFLYLLISPPISIGISMLVMKTKAPNSILLTNSLVTLFNVPFKMVRDNTPLGVPLRAYSDWWVKLAYGPP